MYVGFSKLYEDDNLNVCSNGINIRDVQRYALKSTPQFSEVVSREALQNPLFPSRIEQNRSVRFFFTTSKNGVFLPSK